MLIAQQTSYSNLKQTKKKTNPGAGFAFQSLNVFRGPVFSLLISQESSHAWKGSGFQKQCLMRGFCRLPTLLTLLGCPAAAAHVLAATRLSRCACHLGHLSGSCLCYLQVAQSTTNEAPHCAMSSPLRIAPGLA